MLTEVTIEQKIVVNNDSIIITDPCYILENDDWQEYINLKFSNKHMSLTNYLIDYHNFSSEIIAMDTGVGDWSNSVRRSNTRELIGEFAADSGMVIVCTASDVMNYGVKASEIQSLQNGKCLAVIPDFTGRIIAGYDHKTIDCSGQIYEEKLCVISGISTYSEQENFNTETL